jgi:hypothetical protein
MNETCKNHSDRATEFDSIFGEGRLCRSCALLETEIYIHEFEQDHFGG